MGYWVIKTLLGPLIRLVWVKNVKGLSNIPKEGPAIIAANHSSYFDFISLVAVIPRRIHFLAAEKFYKSIFWRPIMELTGQIKVERKSKDKTEVHREVSRLLSKGRVVGIFPEGTRSPDGKIKRVYPGVAKFALRNKVTVVPIGIIGSYEVMSRYDKFPRKKKAISVNVGKPISFEDHYKKEESEDVCREVTDLVMGSVQELIKDK